MPRRLARILTAIALVVGFGAGISTGATSASATDSHVQTNAPAGVDWWW